MASAVVVLLVLSLWRVLESEAVRSFTARSLESVAKSVADVDLNIGDLQWALVPPRMVLSDVQLEGSGVRADLDWAAVEMGGLAVARRTVILDSVEVRGVRVVLSERPKVTTGSQGSPVRIIVRHLDLEEIEVEGMDLSGGFGMVVEGGEISWLQDWNSTRGFVSVNQANLTVPGIEPLSLGIEASFNRRGDRFEAPTVRLSGTDIDIEGNIVWNGQALTARIRGDLGLDELDRILRARGLLEGSMVLDADIDTTRQVLVKATIDSDRVTVGGFPIEQLQASLELADGGLSAEVHHGRLFGGALRGNYDLGRLAMPFPHRVDATCKGLDLAGLLENLGVPSGGLSSSADISANVSWNSDRFPEGKGKALVDLQGVEGELPTTGLLTLTLNSEGLLQFATEDLTIGSSKVRLEGPLVIGAWAPEWSINIEPAQLGEILPAVNQWVGAEVFPSEISGSGSLDVGLSGPWKQLTVGVRMDVEEVRFPPIELDRLVAEASIGGGECKILDGRYRLGSGGGQINGAIRWAPEPGNEPLDLQIDGHGLPLDAAASWVDLQPGLVSGEAAFTGGLRGSISDSRGSWALGLTDVEIGETNLGSGSAIVNLRDGAVTAAGLSFDRGLEGQVRWDLIEDKLIGDLGWEGMPYRALPESLLRLFGQVFDWHVLFEWSLAEALPVGGLEINGEGLLIQADLDQTGLKALASLEGIGSGDLEARFNADGLSWSGDGLLHVQSVAAVTGRLAPEISPLVTGSIRVPLTIWGSGARIEGLEGRFEDQGLKVRDQVADILGDQGFRWDPSGFRLNGLELGVGGDQVFIRGGVDPSAQLNGNVSGVFDAGLLRIFLPDWEPAGRVTGTVEILGNVSEPVLEGIAKVERASFRLPGTRTVVGDVDGSLFLSAGEVAMEDLSFKFMRGRGRGRGRIGLDQSPPHLRLDGTVEGLDFPLFPDFVPRIEGTWALAGPVDDLELSGDLVVTRAEVRRQDDLPSLLMAWFGDVGPPDEDGLRLDLHIRADENLVSRSPFVRLVGSADIHVTGTDARPGLVGNIEFMEGGEFTLQGIRYELERGQVSFSDPTKIDPMLDFQARADIREYQVWLSVTGTVDRLVPTVSSDPPLNPAEIYSLMALGKVGKGEAGGAVGLTLASTLLTRRMNEVLGSREQWLLPVDQIRVDPFIESATGDPSARVTVVKQLSPSLTVTLQSNLSGDMDEAISARWYLGSGFFIEASRDARNSDPDYGLDFKIRRRY